MLGLQYWHQHAQQQQQPLLHAGLHATGSLGVGKDTPDLTPDVMTAAVRPRSSAASSRQRHRPQHSHNHFPGLVNPGNHCFLNAILQALASMSALGVFLSSRLRDRDAGGVDYDGNGDDDGLSHRADVCKAFNELYMDLNRPGALLRTINPSAFNAVLVGQGRELSDRQEDAFELFDLLASKLSDESLAFACPPSLTDALVPKQPTPSSSMIGGHATTPLLVRMKITSSLEGLLGTTIRCRDCGFSAPVRVVPFDSLPLAVPINTGAPLDLLDLIRRFFEPETISDYQCPKCTVVGTIRVVRDSIADLKVQLRALPRPSSRKTTKTDQANQPNLVAAAAPTQQKLEDRERRRQIKLRRDTLDGITEHEGLLHDLSSILQTGNYEEQFDRLRTNPKYAAMESMRPSVCVKHTASIRLPKDLCVHLGRLTYSPAHGALVKSEAHVAFPLVLDLRWLRAANILAQSTSISEQWRVLHHQQPRVVRASATLSTERSFIYQLTAVIEHEGSAVSGHFVTYRRIRMGGVLQHDDDDDANKDGRWIRCSDESVRDADVTEVCSARAYMLFYESTAL